ncbi:hypothetical protein EYC84_006828 [Monilinia fructicola]|uniref:Uncharacterized protein n=1 Tax=Monilinia fructicola TaxID=38448 RepID=A0A5M9K7C4_MONFR|nr:hypothetical protein EYC84_006828 [Monilinia fructicola]
MLEGTSIYLHIDQSVYTHLYIPPGSSSNDSLSSLFISPCNLPHISHLTQHHIFHTLTRTPSNSLKANNPHSKKPPNKHTHTHQPTPCPKDVNHHHPRPNPELKKTLLPTPRESAKEATTKRTASLTSTTSPQTPRDPSMTTPRRPARRLRIKRSAEGVRSRDVYVVVACSKGGTRMTRCRHGNGGLR